MKARLVEKEIALGLHTIAVVRALSLPTFRRNREAWRQLVSRRRPGFEELTNSVWAAVAATGEGAVRVHDEVLVADRNLIMEVFSDRDGNYSVSGYADRMRRSFGLIYLGRDAGADYQRESAAINQAITKITEAQAFDLARSCADAFLAGIPAGSSIDASELSTRTLAGVCEVWFDLPGDADMIVSGFVGDPCPPARLPGHLATPSGYIFQPHPPLLMRLLGRRSGKKILLPAVLEFVRNHRSTAKKPNGILSSTLFDAFPSASQNELVARTIIGVLMGLLPTTNGNLVAVLNLWLSRGGLFDQLRSAFMADPEPDLHLRAHRVLKQPLMQAMQEQPVPGAVWRTAVKDHDFGKTRSIQVKIGDIMNLDIASATRSSLEDGTIDVLPVFGGDRAAKVAPPTHACPGREAALGIMLGAIAALMMKAPAIDIEPVSVESIQM